jgi:hypothetical protein
MLKRLSGVRVGRGNHPVSVVAYADDVTIFIKSVTEFHVIEEAMCLFEKASGAWLNPKKSQALPIGRWKTFDTVFGFIYHHSVRILSIQFRNNIQRSTQYRISSVQGSKQWRFFARLPLWQVIVFTVSESVSLAVSTRIDHFRKHWILLAFSHYWKSEYISSHTQKALELSKLFGIQWNAL